MGTSIREWLWLLRIHLRQGVLELTPPGSTWFSAVRRAAVVAAFFAVGVLSGDLTTTVMASFGALQVGLFETTLPGRYLTGVLAINVVAVSLAVFAASALGGTWWVLPLIVALGYIYGAVAGLGPGYLAISLGSVALAVIFAGLPQAPDKAAGAAVWVAIGGFTQMALWLLDLRHDRLKYSRRLLAIKVDSMAEIAREGVVTERVVERSFAATDRARTALANAGLDPVQAAAFGGLLDAEVRFIRALITWLVLREPGLADRMQVALHLEALSRSVKTGRALPPQWSTPGAAMAQMDQWLATSAVGEALDHLVVTIDSLPGQKRADDSSSVPGRSQPLPPHGLAEAAEPSASDHGDGVRQSGLARFVAALRPGQPNTRYAVRMAVGLGIAQALTLLVSVGHSFWLPLTVLFTLRPEIAFTVYRGITRVAGNLAAVVLVPTLLLAVGEQKWLVALLVLALASVTYRYFTGNYALTSFGLAGTVLVIDTTLVPGDGLFVTRIVATIAGALLALAMVVAFPVAVRKAPLASAKALTGALREWTAQVCRGLTHPAQSDHRAVIEAQTNSRVALLGMGGDAEGSLFDVRTRRDGVRLVMALDAAWRMDLALVVLSFYARVLQDSGSSGLPVATDCSTITATLASVSGVAASRQHRDGGEWRHDSAVEAAGTGSFAGAAALGPAESLAVNEQLLRLEDAAADLAGAVKVLESPRH